MKSATIMDIQRYSIHDGPGIRTTVFFKGCHMACRWCHNPESQRREPELLFYENRCINCGECMPLCRKNAHSMARGKHRIDLSLCAGCPGREACSRICPAEAIKLCGREMTTKEVLHQVMKDRDFYGSQGGVTCSGGEPLLQDDFLAEFLPLCKENRISVCLDTTLNVEWKRVEKILPWTDLFLVDVKFMENDSQLYYTGTDGKRGLENLYRLSERNIPVIIRMPLINGVSDTDKEISERKKLLKNLKNVRRVDCFAVSDHAAGKYRALQRTEEKFNRGVEEGPFVKSIENKLGILHEF